MKQRLVGGATVWLDYGDRTQAIAYLTRRYDQRNVKLILSRLPRGGQFFDVGANVGLISAQISHYRPDVSITSFEPNPAAVEILRRNLADTRSTIVTAAVAASTGAARFVAPEHDLGGGRILPDPGDGDGFEIDVVSLDTYCRAHGIRHVDVLKVDVEGAEPDVLAGARKLLTRSIDTVLLEANDTLLDARGASRRDLITSMKAHGFRPLGRTDGTDIAFEHS
jgi:FkbM family methyltransferase